MFGYTYSILRIYYTTEIPAPWHQLIHSRHAIIFTALSLNFQTPRAGLIVSEIDAGFADKNNISINAGVDNSDLQ